MNAVAVIGAGVVGLSIAVQLRRRGYDVLVLERDVVGSGASAGNAGWIVPALSAPVPSPGAIGYGLRSLLHRDGVFSIRPIPTPAMIGWGLRFAGATRRSAFDAGVAATARFAAGAARSFADLTASGLEIEARTSGMLIVFGDEASASSELAAYSPLRDFGVELDDEVLDSSALRALEPALGREARAGLHFPAEQYIDPLQLTRALVRLAESEGVRILERTTVARLSRDRSTTIHLLSGEAITDRAVVIAAGAQSDALARGIGYRLPMQPGKGYSVTVSPHTMPVKPIYIPAAKAALTPLDDGMRIAGVMQLGSRSLRIDDARLSRMRDSSEAYFAEDFDGDADNAWAGLRPVTADGLPVIGRVPGVDDAYIATGHAMLGVTLGPLTGEALAAIVADGVHDPVLEPFSPGRFGRR